MRLTSGELNWPPSLNTPLAVTVGQAIICHIANSIIMSEAEQKDRFENVSSISHGSVDCVKESADVFWFVFNSWQLEAMLQVYVMHKRG